MKTIASDSKNTFIYNLINVLMKNKAAVLCVILIAVTGLMSDYFLNPTNIFNVLKQISYTAIVAVGFTLVCSAGEMDLSVGTMMGLLGVLMAMMVKANVPVVVAIIAGIILGGLFGAGNALISTGLQLPTFVVTLATQYIFKGITYIITKVTPVVNLPDEFVKFGQGYCGPIPLPIIIVLIVAVIGYFIMNHTVFGRHILAKGGNSSAAEACGINTRSIRLGVFVASGICAAIGALVLTGRVGAAQVNAGQGTEMDAVAAIVIGGTQLFGGSANMPGTIFGCLLVGIVNNMMNLTGIDPNWQIVTKGLMIVIAVGIDVTSNRIMAKFKKK